MARSGVVRGRQSKILYIYYIVLVTCCERVAVCGWTGFASGGVCAMVVRERSRKRSERKEVFFRRVYTYNNNLLRLLLCLRRCRRSSRRKTERSVGLTRAIPPPSPTIAACYVPLTNSRAPAHFTPVVQWKCEWRRSRRPYAARAPANRACMLGGGCRRFGDRRVEWGSYARSMCVRLRAATVRANGSESNMAAAARAHDRANSARPGPAVRRWRRQRDIRFSSLNRAVRSFSPPFSLIYLFTHFHIMSYFFFCSCQSVFFF